MRRRRSGKKPPIYNLKITLEEVEPTVWRRFRADPLCTLPLLSLIIQRVMGWENCHLHRFEARDERYGMRHPEIEPDGRDESRFRLGSLVKTPGESFTYIYDFGDHWRHTVVLEGTIERSRSVVHPKCTDGENACPPEDVGGSRGYRRLQLVLANPALKEYADTREWVGPVFDPGRFELDYQNLSMWNLRGTKLPWWA